MKFKAFQFTEANTKATLYAKPGGAFTCSFSIKWKWKPIGFDDDSLCDALCVQVSGRRRNAAAAATFH